MSIYYSDTHITLYHGDCHTIDAWLQADVLVTDPPYGMDFRSNFRVDRRDRFDAISGDDTTETRDAALRMWWASGHTQAAVFGTWKQPRPAGVTQVLIWNKHATVGMGDLSDAFGTSHEEIYLFGKWGRTSDIRRRGSVLTTVGPPMQEAQRVGHPTPKPVGLIEQLIEVTGPGAVIADPFAGSGSTLLAARNLGRRAIGVEIDERYCEIIARRLDQMCLDFGDAARVEITSANRQILADVDAFLGRTMKAAKPGEWRQDGRTQRRTDADGTEWTIVWPGIVDGVVQPVTLTMRYRDHLLSSTHADEDEAKLHRADMLRAFAARSRADYAQPASTAGDGG